MKALTVARLGYGAPLLLAPGLVLRIVSGGRSDGATVVARILGAQHVAQALTLDRAGSRGWVLLGAGVDLLRARIINRLAALSADYRQAASLDTSVAFAMAACGLRRVRHG